MNLKAMLEEIMVFGNQQMVELLGIEVLGERNYWIQRSWKYRYGFKW